VEDEAGQRFWLFRAGHYDAAKTYGWFLHGFFA
jgi:protein ImuB